MWHENQSRCVNSSPDYHYRFVCVSLVFLTYKNCPSFKSCVTHIARVHTSREPVYLNVRLKCRTRKSYFVRTTFVPLSIRNSPMRTSVCRERKRLLYMCWLIFTHARVFLQRFFFSFSSYVATALSCVKLVLKIQFGENNEIYTYYRYCRWSQKLVGNSGKNRLNYLRAEKDPFHQLSFTSSYTRAFPLVIIPIIVNNPICSHFTLIIDLFSAL